MAIKGESLLWALGALAQLNRTPFDAKLILQQFPPPYTRGTLHEAANRLGLKVGFKRVHAAELGNSSLPCLALLKPAAIEAPPGLESGAANDPKVTPIAAGRVPSRSKDADANTHELVLIVQADEDQIACFEAVSPALKSFAQADFAQRFTGEVLQFGRQVPALQHAERGAQPRAFGFSWFV